MTRLIDIEDEIQKGIEGGKSWIISVFLRLEVLGEFGREAILPDDQLAMTVRAEGNAIHDANRMTDGVIYVRAINQVNILLGNIGIVRD